MVNGITSSPGPAMPDISTRVAAGPVAQPAEKIQAPEAKVAVPSPQALEKAKLEVARTAPTAAPVSPSMAGPLVAPLTSLALYKDGESGMNVAVIRDRVSGQVIEQVPTERARRLAAMVRQQEVVAQELQRAGQAARLDFET